MYSYSINDRETAAYILTNQGLDMFGKALYPSSWVSWATKCIRWWARFYQLLKAYARPSGGVGFAVKAIWANLKRGMSLVGMLRKVFKADPPEPSKWMKPRFNREETKRNGMPVQYMRTHSNKTEYRTKNSQLTDRMQVSC